MVEGLATITNNYVGNSLSGTYTSKSEEEVKAESGYALMAILGYNMNNFEFLLGLRQNSFTFKEIQRIIVAKDIEETTQQLTLGIGYRF